jgi:hypothetical protein
LVDYRLAERGIDSKTVLAHIPHYLAVLPYPSGTIALLERVSDVAPLTFDLSRLAAAAEQTDRQVARQVAEAEELSEVVRELERRYDEQAASGPLALPGESLPGAEDIAAELEAFLAGLDQGESGKF